MGVELGKLVSASAPDAPTTPGVPVALFESDPILLSSADILAGTVVEVVPTQPGKALIALALLAHTDPGAAGYDTPTTVIGFAGPADSPGTSLSPMTEFEYALSTTDEWTTFDQQPSLPLQPGAQAPASLEGPITIAIQGATAGDGAATVRVLYYAVDIP